MRSRPLCPLLVVLSSLLFLGAAQGLTEVWVDDVDRPHSAVVLVVEGMGSCYVYPDQRAQALDGTFLGQACLFNLTSGGARISDLKVPVPISGCSQSVLFTGCSWADPDMFDPPGISLFDLARESGLLCVAIFQGDCFMHGTMPIVLEQDAVLLFDDPSLQGGTTVVGARDGAPPRLISALQEWRDLFPLYTSGAGVERYAGSNAWALDTASDMIEVFASQLGSQPFLLTLNLGASDLAGRDLGYDGYLVTIAALDAPLGRLIQVCEENDVLLLVTSDHGIVFSSECGRGESASVESASVESYSKMERLCVPAVFFGPGVDDIIVAGTWSQADLAPTIADLLDLNGALSLTEGASIPIAEHYDLEVQGADPSEKVVLHKEGRLVAEASGDPSYLFRGLKRGAYDLSAGGRVESFCLNGDHLLDLSSDKFRLLDLIWASNLDFVTFSGWSGWQSQKFAGVVLMLMINFTGVCLITRIVKKG